MVLIEVSYAYIHLTTWNTSIWLSRMSSTIFSVFKYYAKHLNETLHLHRHINA